MPSSSSEARSRVGLLAWFLLPLWACATGVDNAPAGSSSLSASGASGELSDGGSASSSAGSGASAASGSVSSSAGKGGATTGAAGSGASGAPSQSGGPGSAGSAGKGGASSGAGGASSAGSGGTSGAGSGGKGGMSSGGGGSGSVAGSGASGAGSGAGAGAGSGGATGGTTCDAAHALATIASSQVYTGKANDCVRLAVNPTWSAIALKFIPQPGTAPYPVPFSFFSCGGNGTGSLTADYVEAAFKAGPNPGCDFFVQFEGGATTIKVTYYN